jgi:purine nucleoside permease
MDEKSKPKVSNACFASSTEARERGKGMFMQKGPGFLLNAQPMRTVWLKYVVASRLKLKKELSDTCPHKSCQANYCSWPAQRDPRMHGRDGGVRSVLDRWKRTHGDLRGQQRADLACIASDTKAVQCTSANCRNAELLVTGFVNDRKQSNITTSPKDGVLR